MEGRILDGDVLGRGMFDGVWRGVVVLTKWVLGVRVIIQYLARCLDVPDNLLNLMFSNFQKTTFGHNLIAGSKMPSTRCTHSTTVTMCR